MAHRGGGFSGQLKVGAFASMADWLYERTRRTMQRWQEKQERQLNAGLASLSDLIVAASTGGRRSFEFTKTDFTGVIGSSTSMWTGAGKPDPGTAISSGAGAPGGRALTSASTGAIPFDNPTGGNVQKLVSAFPTANVAGSTLLLYDRLFEVNKTMSSSATEAVTGVPTRYQNTSTGTVDSAEGNFVFIEAQGALSATAHNWTVCQYTNQANTGGQALPSVTGISSAIQARLDMSNTPPWFCPLATGDTGILKLTQMQCSSAALTGTVAFVLGHPLAWFPIPATFYPHIWDGINRPDQMPRIFDNACMAFMNVSKTATTQTAFFGSLITLRG
jgi:hypothetical protein